MRAVTGFGGGGLMTMATIVNSDMIPFRRRGMYQALQNTVFGFGATSGASFGGVIADTIGWRWCFLLQVPVSVVAFVLGWMVVQNPDRGDERRGSAFGSMWAKVDFSGAILLVIALSIQCVGLSLGGNELPWSSGWVIGSLVGSTVLLAGFVWVESRTPAIPIIPLRMLSGTLSVSVQIANVCCGLAAYAVSSEVTGSTYERWSIADNPAVVFHTTTFLPSCSPRLCIESWRTPCNTIISISCRRRDRRLCHLALWQAHRTRPLRRSMHGNRQRTCHLS